MPELELQTGSQISDSVREPGLDAVRARIAALSSFDVPPRMADLQKLLAEINSARFAGAQRFDLLAAIDIEIETTLSGYRETIRHNAFPLPANADTLYNGMQALLAQAADAYKVLILGLLSEGSDDSRIGLLHTAILRCICYLGQLALQAYAVYRTAPDTIWPDLHRLYVYSEHRRFHNTGAGQDTDLSIHAAYTRTLLLALANPHHLMQGEIYQAYTLLEKWALAVRLERPADTSPDTPFECIARRFFCDVAGDGPPGFGIEGITRPPVDPRLLNLDEVLAIINRRMKTLALSHQRSLQLRSEWDLLQRLRSAWEKRPLRKEERQIERGTSVKAIVGLTSCHDFYSGYTPFEPEQTEIEIHGGGFTDAPTLSLVPSDETPWLDADAQAKLKSGVIKPRAYLFDVDNRENDIWKKAHASGQRVDTELEKTLEQSALGKIFTFSLINTSIGGVGLQTPPNSPVQLRVGELAAAFPHGDDDGGDPVLNVVRWIHCSGGRKLLVGLRHIDGDITPVAVRSLQEDAHFQSYARGFFMEDSSGSCSLVVPTGLFEYGSMLLVNHGDRIETMQLTSLVQNTRAFSQFNCKTAAVDAQRDEYIISSLKKLLRDDA